MPYHLSYFVPVVFMLLTMSIFRPDLTPDLWLALTRMFERRRAERLARKSALVEQKMKKYWVIDMRKLR